MDDGELIRAVSRGDDLALRELFDRYAALVAARLRRVMPVDAVEDTLQETFIAVWRGASTYTGEGEVGAWVWGIARRQAAMWLRRRGHVEAELVEDVQAAAGDDPAAIAQAKSDLQQALAALGPAGNEQRELARLVWEEDRSVAEVASILGVPQGTVKSRVHALRRLVRAALGR
jgi:RNA polymerase sigma-70 factor (ECF subfamily)